jgi:gentisate 1,2-dioxygenase
VPSWVSFSARSEAGSSDSDSGALDLFRFSDSPVFEALGLGRSDQDAHQDKETTR